MPPIIEHVLSWQEQEHFRALKNSFVHSSKQRITLHNTSIQKVISCVSTMESAAQSYIGMTGKRMLWHFGSDDSEYSFTCLSSCNNLSVGTVLFMYNTMCVPIASFMIMRIWYYTCKWFIEHPCTAWYGYSAIVSYSTLCFFTIFFRTCSKLISKFAYGAMNVQFCNCNDIV